MEKSKRRNGNNWFEMLGPDNISNIICRLPIEWILCCMCVCKNWYSLIKQDYFVKLQLKFSNEHPSSRVLFESSESFEGILKLFLLENSKPREIPGFSQEGIRYKYSTVMSSLDGLICFASLCPLDPAVIFNPLIRGDCVFLPKTEPREEGFLHYISLGFDHSIKKYKAVRMMRSYNRGLCEVITLGGKETTWRQVASPNERVILELFNEGVFHQGSIYWIIGNGKTNDSDYDTINSSSDDGEEIGYISDEGDEIGYVSDYGDEIGYVSDDGDEIKCSNDNREYILEFDVTKEVFRVIKFPHSVRVPINECKPNTNLQILGGNLTLMQIVSGLLHQWAITKENGNPVIRYSSVMIMSPNDDVPVLAFRCLNGTKDFMLLKTNNYGYEEQYLYFYPFSSFSKRSDRIVVLSDFSRFASFYGFCYKPSLLSAEAAIVRDW